MFRGLDVKFRLTLYHGLDGGIILAGVASFWISPPPHLSGQNFQKYSKESGAHRGEEIPPCFIKARHNSVAVLGRSSTVSGTWYGARGWGDVFP